MLTWVMRALFTVILFKSLLLSEPSLWRDSRLGELFSLKQPLRKKRFGICHCKWTVYKFSLGAYLPLSHEGGSHFWLMWWLIIVEFIEALLSICLLLNRPRIYSLGKSNIDFKSISHSLYVSVGCFTLSNWGPHSVISFPLYLMMKHEFHCVCVCVR